jgi:hypothetical protein
VHICHRVVLDFDLDFSFFLFVSVAEVFCLPETASNLRFETQIGNLET